MSRKKGCVCCCSGLCFCVSHLLCHTIFHPISTEQQTKCAPTHNEWDRRRRIHARMRAPIFAYCRHSIELAYSNQVCKHTISSLVWDLTTIRHCVYAAKRWHIIANASCFRLHSAVRSAVSDRRTMRFSTPLRSPLSRSLQFASE